MQLAARRCARSPATQQQQQRRRRQGRQPRAWHARLQRCACAEAGAEAAGGVADGGVLGTRSFTPARSWAEDDADVAVRVSAAAQALLEAAPPGAEAAAADEALLLWYLRD